ncbi:STM3941 family protein [Xylophilus sp. Leaf220]|uniref:STM3941 family protein n=1 Tax=Xylophilus sp. Leaf220 TaxID=1735686 RepID=UPI0006F6C2A4|nr:STM3941 family protein [Xylophilus sp. Leaf220]KQM68995.1 hypothetical protein ASE76_12120 [Xylophilus sp. Leaf220]
MNIAPSLALERSRAKALLLLTAAAALAAAGLWLLLRDAAWLAGQSRFESLVPVRVLSALAWAGMALCLRLGWRGWTDRTPGLTFDADGIVDQISSVQAGRIAWSGITGLAVLKVRHQFTLVVQVADAQALLDRAPALGRTLAEADHRLCGSPVAIPAGALRIGFDDLVQVAHAYRGHYGGAVPAAAPAI